MAVDLTVDVTERFQTIDGFGTSLGGSTPPNLVKSDDFQEMYYQDLGASMLRVALNFSTLKAADGNLATPVYLGEDMMENIKLFDWNQYNINLSGTMARASLNDALDETKIIAAIWSPPHWMKGPELNPNNGNVTNVMPVIDYSRGAPNASGGSLIDSPENLQQFGRWAAAYVKGFELQFGTPIYALSVQNELAFHQWYHSAVYTPELYVKALKAVKQEFVLQGITTKLIGPEDVGVGSEQDPYILRRQFEYIKAIRQDPEAFAALDGYAVHGYANNGVNTYRSPEMWSQYWNGRKPGDGPAWTGIKNDGKFSWMTEISGDWHTWTGGMRVAQAAQDALTQGNVGAWVYWGIANGNTTYSNEALTAGLDNQAYKYVGAKHFFRYIRPGAERVQVNGSDPQGVYASAFVHDANRTVTSVVINGTKKRQEINLALPGVLMTGFDIGYISSRDYQWRQLKTVKIRNGTATFTLPAESMLTLSGNTVKPGSIGGFYFNDADGDGAIVRGEVGLGGDKVFIDANDNGVRDRREKYALTAADGSFTFASLFPGEYKIRREMPQGWTQTTEALNVTVGSGDKLRRLLIGARPDAPLRASLRGTTFDDTGADGRFGPGDVPAIAKTIFLDADDDGELDAGERSVTSGADGAFAFDDLDAGVYHVRRLFPGGFTYSTTKIDLTLGDGEQARDLLIGAKSA